MTILVTGVAGFIGFQLARKLLQKGQDVVGLDNVNDYYDVSLKEARLRELEEVQGFRFMRLDIAEGNEIDGLFAAAKLDVVINLAAQAGVRYSLVNPHAYVRSNIEGFVNVLEACRRHEVRHLIYASSSSVYGAVTKMPFSVHQNVDHPVSVYGATKKANELLAHSYSHLFGLPTTGLRFFTVYGPWGRPDMALFIFTRAILENKPIQIFNHGRMERDFTYIDDIVEAVEVQHLIAYMISEIIVPRACCVWSRFWKTALAGRPINSFSRCNRETYPRRIPMWVTLRAKSGSCRRLHSRAASNSLNVGTVAFIAFRGGRKRRPVFRNTSYRSELSRHDFSGALETLTLLVSIRDRHLAINWTHFAYTDVIGLCML
jgi:nucleoside-diphosphate-sugar epimerase